MRIISGQYKGQKIISPGSRETHPMGAREKLALFNMLDRSEEHTTEIQSRHEI